MKDFRVRKAIGYELRADLYKSTLQEIEKQNLTDRIRLVNMDFYEAPISEATVITIYLTTSANERLKPKLMKEVYPGLRVISHDFSMEGWEPAVREKFEDHTLYLYILPDAYKK